MKKHRNRGGKSGKSGKNRGGKNRKVRPPRVQCEFTDLDLTSFGEASVLARTAREFGLFELQAFDPADMARDPYGDDRDGEVLIPRFRSGPGNRPWTTRSCLRRPSPPWRPPWAPSSRGAHGARG